MHLREPVALGCQSDQRSDFDHQLITAEWFMREHKRNWIISIAKLNTLLRLHMLPINQVVYLDP